MALSTRTRTSCSRRSRSPFTVTTDGASTTISTPRVSARGATRRATSRARTARSTGCRSRARSGALPVERASRSPTRRPRRSLSDTMSSISGDAPGDTSDSRASTSAVARMSAAGVRSSWDASATNRSWASKDARIGTIARRVTMRVTRPAPHQAQEPDDGDGQDQAARLGVVEGEHESGLREAHRPGERTDRQGQEPDRDAAGRDRPQVAGRSRRGRERLDDRQPGQVDERRVRDDPAARIEVQHERIRGSGSHLLGIADLLLRGELPTRTGDRRLGRRAQGAVHLCVERPEGGDRGRDADPDDQQGHEQEAREVEPPAGGVEEPSGRSARPARLRHRPGGCIRPRARSGDSRPARGPPASVAGSGCTGRRHSSRRRARRPRRRRGSGAG